MKSWPANSACTSTSRWTEKNWSWGFNVIFIGGCRRFVPRRPPRAVGRTRNPRFGSDFTDLNLTAHLNILTEGGVDIKAGRQTTCLGPMGALAWQRPFNSSDYAWYNLEEGRYTGVSANWIHHQAAVVVQRRRDRRLGRLLRRSGSRRRLPDPDQLLARRGSQEDEGLDHRPDRPDRLLQRRQHHDGRARLAAQLQRALLPDHGLADDVLEGADLLHASAGLPGTGLRRVHRTWATT